MTKSPLKGITKDEESGCKAYQRVLIYLHITARDKVPQGSVQWVTA